MIRKKGIPLQRLFSRRQSILKDLRRTKDGCLEYVGPQKGGSVGNPLVGIEGGKSTVHLRKWIWEQNNGPLKKGTYVRMTVCGNRKCHEYRHMTVVTSHRPYGPYRSEYVSRIPEDQIREIRYFQGKVPASVISKVFGIRAHVISGIWRSTSAGKVALPRGWKPGRSVIERVEREAQQVWTVYLGPEKMEMAIRDINSSELGGRDKKIVLDVVSGKTTSVLGRKFGLSAAGIRYVYNKALRHLEDKYGKNQWIMLVRRKTSK
jgi:hypothetical protein